MTGTCYNFEMEEFFSSFCVAWVCQHQLGFLVEKSFGGHIRIVPEKMCVSKSVASTILKLLAFNPQNVGVMSRGVIGHWTQVSISNGFQDIPPQTSCAHRHNAKRHCACAYHVTCTPYANFKYIFQFLTPLCLFTMSLSLSSDEE